MIGTARKKQETLVLFPEVLSITRKFSDEQFGTLMRAVFSYRFDGEVYSGNDAAIDVAFQTVANQIDRYQEFCDTLSRNAKGNKVQQGTAKCSKIQQSAPPIQSMSNPCPYPYPIQSSESIAAEPPHPRPFGKYENVFLSDEQVAELKNEFPSDWMQRIERLSEYMESSGRKYSNHLATIRMWAREEAPKETERGDSECRILSL